VKTRALRAAIKFLQGMIDAEDVPIPYTIEAGVLVGKLKREAKANGVKLTKRRKRRHRKATDSDQQPEATTDA